MDLATRKAPFSSGIFKRKGMWRLRPCLTTSPTLPAFSYMESLYLRREIQLVFAERQVVIIQDETVPPRHLAVNHFVAIPPDGNTASTYEKGKSLKGCRLCCAALLYWLVSSLVWDGLVWVAPSLSFTTRFEELL